MPVLKIKIGGLLIVTDLLIAQWRTNRNEKSPCRTIQRGTNLDLDIEEENLVPREDIVNKLKRVFQPAGGLSFFHTIVGEEGIGKTVAVKQAAREVRNGVVYVKVPEDLNNFGDEFAKALQWRFETTTFMAAIGRMIVGTSSRFVLSPSEKITRALEAFDRGAMQYKAKYGEAPVLILDNMSKLAKEEPRILNMLQDYAKDRAAQSKYNVVFVSNKTVPSMTMTHSSKAPIKIEDLTETEALQYLNNLGVEEKSAKQLYGLLGGRIGHLRKYGDALRKGTTFEDVRKEAFLAIENDFYQAKMLKGKENYKVGRRIITKLLRNNKISLGDYNQLHNNGDIADELLQANVISFNPADRTIAFQSRLAEMYAREKF